MAAVRWTQRARDGLRDIHDFIAWDSPRAAEALVERLLTATERLAAFPESGHVVPEFPALSPTATLLKHTLQTQGVMSTSKAVSLVAGDHKIVILHGQF